MVGHVGGGAQTFVFSVVRVESGGRCGARLGPGTTATTQREEEYCSVFCEVVGLIQFFQLCAWDGMFFPWEGRWVVAC